MARRSFPCVVLAATAALGACRGGSNDRPVTVTIAGSAVGAEGEVLSRQVAQFEQDHPAIDVIIQRTPDDATQRHQLFVQWLNAHVGRPDVLQLDVIWTPEFAAAGWILPLTRWTPRTDDFFPGVIAADRWRDTLYAIPWWTDVGMLYWRTDLLAHAPADLDSLPQQLAAIRSQGGPRYGLVWQGARYEGLVTVFVEFLGAFGGEIMNDSGAVVVDSPRAIAALSFMRNLIRSGAVPSAAMTWHEEEARAAFQQGNAVLMRNWPYAYALMNDSTQSRVAGRFAVAPMPAALGGTPTAALGGQQLAINRWSEHPDSAWELVAFLTAPAQMLQRAQISGSFPPRRSLYDDPALDSALAVPSATARALLEHATPRPVTPVYSQLSDLLQIQLHRALTGQAAPADALHEAARQMNALLERSRL
ncbi:MAG TPA: ABC transporter substrate-binding protein [Gemmatimonadales bacterium]|nr:ABC transporter substrate-binding protein [Gemmatimonadales bacterium]